MTNGLAERLLDVVLGGGGALGVAPPAPARLSLIGLSKNAGKTTTINHLVRAAAGRSLPLGLVSTGRDGEEQDAITELPKPRIWAPAGTWVATAKAALCAGSARMTPVQELPIKTPFGSVVVGRVQEAGEVLLIGPGSAQRVAEVLGGLEAHGARLCLVDGSFDRIAAAAPAVTGRVVLAAGAAYSHSMAETLAQVRHVLDLFDLPPVPPPLQAAAEAAAAGGPVHLITPGGEMIEIPVASALGDPEPILAAVAGRAASDTHLLISGALTDRLLTALLQHRTPLGGLVLPDPTHILVARGLWRRWRRQGGLAYVRHPVRLLAVTINAYSPTGKGYDAQAFFDAMRASAQRPVFDLQVGLANP